MSPSTNEELEPLPLGTVAPFTATNREAASGHWRDPDGFWHPATSTLFLYSEVGCGQLSLVRKLDLRVDRCTVDPIRERRYRAMCDVPSAGRCPMPSPTLQLIEYEPPDDGSGREWDDYTPANGYTTAKEPWEPPCNIGDAGVDRKPWRSPIEPSRVIMSTSTGPELGGRASPCGL